MSQSQPTQAQYSLIMRVRLSNRPGMLGRVAVGGEPDGDRVRGGGDRPAGGGDRLPEGGVVGSGGRQAFHDEFVEMWGSYSRGFPGVLVPNTYLQVIGVRS